MKVLHLSYHLGCFRDQQYIITMLGGAVENLSAAEIETYTITKEIADKFWNKYKEKFNSYDYVVVSDTSALSRIILQNIDEFKSKLIIWICNRFDYSMWGETDFYRLIDKYKIHPQVKIVAYTLWEKIWCLKKGIDIMTCPVITPLGKSIKAFEYNIPKQHSRVFTSLKDTYSGDYKNTVFVPNYCNDNVYFDMAKYLNSVGVIAYNGVFLHPQELKDFKAYVTAPDAMSKLFCFESIHEEIPVVLPSPKRLLELTKGNYLFNLTGHGGGQNLTIDLVDFCEWYKEKFKPIRIYYDTLEELPDKIASIDRDKLSPEFKRISKDLEVDVINSWKSVYASF